MKVRIWAVFNPKNCLFWSNEFGWTTEASCDYFNQEEKESVNLPMEGIWVPHIAGPCSTTDDLIEALKLFPAGTRLVGYHGKVEGNYNVKVFGGVRDSETEEDADADENDNAQLFATIALF